MKPRREVINCENRVRCAGRVSESGEQFVVIN